MVPVEELCKYLLPHDLIALSLVNKYFYSRLRDIPTYRQLKLKKKMMHQMKAVTQDFARLCDRVTFELSDRYFFMDRISYQTFQLRKSDGRVFFDSKEKFVLWCGGERTIYFNLMGDSTKSKCQLI